MITMLFILNPIINFLVPAWFDPKIDNTRVSHAEADGVAIQVENLVVNDQQMIFDVTIDNNRTGSVPVNPGSIYILGSDKPFPPDSDINLAETFESQLAKHYALDETHVASQFRHKIAAQQTRTAIFGLLGVGLMIWDAAADAGAYHHEWTPHRANGVIFRDWITAAGLTALNLADDQAGQAAGEKSQDLYYLNREILKHQIIPEGGSARGKVFFPSDRHTYYRLIIPAGDTDYTFDFRQATEADYRKLRGQDDRK